MNKRYAIIGVVLLALLWLLVWLARQQSPSPPVAQPAKTESSEPARRQLVEPLPPVELMQSEAPALVPNQPVVTNAASLYRQAFTLYDALSADEKWIVSDWRTNVDASVEAELCEKMAPIRSLMQQAALATNCDWGLPTPSTNALNTLLPLLASSRALARASMWNAAHCHEGDATAALDDFEATSRLGHSLPHLLVGYLTDMAIQGLTQDFIAQHASTFAGLDDSRLQQLLDDAQFDNALERTIEGERNFTLGGVADFSEDMKRSLAQMYPQTSSMNLDQINEYIRQAREWKIEYINALQMPDADYQQWLARLHDAEKTNPFIQNFVSAIDSTIDRTRRAIVTATMVQAGLAVMRDGADALQSHPDPVSGQPFTYTETATGFELQSRFQVNGKPLTMQFK